MLKISFLSFYYLTSSPHKENTEDVNLGALIAMTGPIESTAPPF